MPRDETYLLYMMQAARRVYSYTAGIRREQFDTESLRQDGIVLQIGNIGEAASHLSAEFRSLHPEIPWPQIIGMRHRIFHTYQQVDWNRVWTTATVFVPQLISLLEPLMPTNSGRE